MRLVIIFCFTLLFSNMSAQLQSTFVYEITLYEKFKHPTSWGEREHQIQKQHLRYLEELTQSGKLKIAGIINQGLEDQIGFIILNASTFEEAKKVAMNDPSVKNGMMSVRLLPLNVYFEGKY